MVNDKSSEQVDLLGSEGMTVAGPNRVRGESAASSATRRIYDEAGPTNAAPAG